MAFGSARQGSSQPLIGTESALGISVNVARRVIRDLTNGKHEEPWQSICGQRQAKGFLKNPSAKKVGKLLNLSRNQLRIFRGLVTGHCHLKGHLALVNIPKCHRCKQVSEITSSVHFDSQTLVTLRSRHLGHYFMKPADFEDISVSRILQFVQGAGSSFIQLPMENHGQSAHITQCLLFCSLFYFILFYSILIYSILFYPILFYSIAS